MPGRIATVRQSHVAHLGGSLIVPLMLLGIVFSFPSYGEDAPLSAELPLDVHDFIERREACVDWMKRASADPQHTADMASWDGLKCGNLAGEQTELVHRYEGNQQIKQALGALWVKVVRRVPVRPAPEVAPDNTDKQTVP